MGDTVTQKRDITDGGISRKRLKADRAFLHDKNMQSTMY